MTQCKTCALDPRKCTKLSKDRDKCPKWRNRSETENVHGVTCWKDTYTCVCHEVVWHQCPKESHNRNTKKYINKQGVVSTRSIPAGQTIQPEDVLVEDHNVCSCHNEYWRKCPNIVPRKVYGIEIAGEKQIIQVDATRNDEVAMPDTPRTLAKINADIKKTQNRLSINDRMEDDTKGLYTCWTGIIIGICAATSFIFFPWMAGLAGIVVAIITVWAGITAFTDEKRLMTASQIAELQDKLIDLEAEAEDAQLEMVKEYNQR